MLISINDSVNMVLFLNSYFKQLQPSDIPQVESVTQCIDTTRLHIQDSCIFSLYLYSTSIQKLVASYQTEVNLVEFLYKI